jgi:hypothetical protein
MRAKPKVGRGRNDESPVRPKGFRIRCAQFPVANVSIPIRMEPCGIDGWIDKISRAWKGGPENTLALARLLHQARRNMEHGQWSRLWRSERVPFSKRKAEMLVIVGQGLEEVNANNCSHLPSSWRTLYYIAQLGRELAERLIAEGRIHPRLQLRQARELAAEFRPELALKSPGSSPLKRRLDGFSKYVQTHSATWSRLDRQLFHAELKRLFKTVPFNSTPLMTNSNSYEHTKSA